MAGRVSATTRNGFLAIPVALSAVFVDEEQGVDVSAVLRHCIAPLREFTVIGDFKQPSRITSDIVPVADLQSLSICSLVRADTLTDILNAAAPFRTLGALHIDKRCEFSDESFAAIASALSSSSPTLSALNISHCGIGDCRVRSCVLHNHIACADRQWVRTN